MRHFRSILYALVLGPAVWVLAGVGLTEDLTARGRDGFAVEALTGLLLLVLAGTAYGILVLGPISPAGPVLAGVVYLAVGLWAMLAPTSYGEIWPAPVAKEGFDISRPGYGVAAMLAVPLICTALSARRWEKYVPPVLPIIGPIRGFRGTAAAPGMPVSVLQTTSIVPGFPEFDPEPTTVLRMPDDPDHATVMRLPTGVASEDTTVVGVVSEAELVEALEDEATLAGPPQLEERTTTVVVSGDEEAVVTVLSVGEASTRLADEGDETTVMSADGDAAAEATEPVIVAEDEPAVDAAHEEDEVTEPVASEERAPETAAEEEATEPVVETAEGDEVTEPVAASDEDVTEAVVEAAAEDVAEPVAASDDEVTEPVIEAVPEDDAVAAAAADPASAGADVDADEVAGEPDGGDRTEVIRLPVGEAGAKPRDDGAHVVRLPVGDAADDTQVVRLPVRDAGEKTQVVRLPVGDAGDTQVVRLPVADGERTQVIRLPLPSGAEKTREIKPPADVTQVVKFPKRPADGVGERTRDLAYRATGDVGGDETQVIRLPGQVDDERTQVIRPNRVPHGERTEVLQFRAQPADVTVSIADAESPNFAEDPTGPINVPDEKTTDSVRRSMTVTNMERAQDEIAEDTTVHIDIPAQRQPSEDKS